jgi:hypothetical protein
MSDFYTPLGDAVNELKKRVSSPLAEMISNEFNLRNGLEILFQKTHIVIFRQVATPINEIIRIFHIAKMYELDVLIIEYVEDKFTPSINPFKYGLGKLPIYNGDADNLEKNIIHKLNIVDFARMEGKAISEVMSHQKEYIVDIHHDLFEDILKLKINETAIDASCWLMQFKGAREYYQQFFKFFLAHNILAEIFQLTGEEEKFTNDTILPILNNIHTQYNTKPLIWNYLDDTPNEMKYYWECYPKRVGDLLKQKGYY